MITCNTPVYMVRLHGKKKLYQSALPQKNFYDNDPEQVSRYVYALKFIENKTVLDAACGRGYGTYFISKKSKTMVGADIRKDYIEFAQNNYSSNNIQFLESDVTKINLSDNTFDVIISFETIEHLQDADSFLREVVRLLKNDGILLLSTPNRDLSSQDHEKPINQLHVKEYSEMELRESLSRFFSSVEIMGQNPKSVNVVLVQDYLRKYNYWNSIPQTLRKLIPNVLKNQLIKTLRFRRGPYSNFSWDDVVIEKFKPNISFTLVALCKEPRKESH